MATRIGLSLIEGAHPSLVFGSNWTAAEILASVDAWAEEVRVSAGFAPGDLWRCYPATFGIWSNWTEAQYSRFPRADLMDGLRDRGIVPAIQWYGTSDQHASFYQTLQGANDAYIDQWCADARMWANSPTAAGNTVGGAPKSARIIVRPFFEMNGSWFPWAGGKPVTAPSAQRNTVDGPTNGFIPFFRYLHDRVRITNGCPNVEFFWCPHAGDGLDYFPGDRWVEYVGSDWYHDNPGLSNPTTLYSLLVANKTALEALTSKRYMVGEYGMNKTNGSGVLTQGGTGNAAQRTQWYEQSVLHASNNDYDLVLFDLDMWQVPGGGEKDWTLDRGLHTWTVYGTRSGTDPWETFAEAFGSRQTRFPTMAAPPLNPAFAYDTFTDTGGTGLAQHTSDHGHKWGRHPVLNAGTAEIRSDRAQHTEKATPNDVAYFHQVVPPTSAYEVDFSVRVVGTMPAGQKIRLYVRMSPTAETWYCLLLWRDWPGGTGGAIKGTLEKVTNGLNLVGFAPAVTAGTFDNTAVHDYRVSVLEEGPAGTVRLKWYRDGVLKQTVEDANPILAVGRLGIGWFNDAPSTLSSNIGVTTIAAYRSINATAVTPSVTLAWTPTAPAVQITQPAADATAIPETAALTWTPDPPSASVVGGATYGQAGLIYNDPGYTYGGASLVVDAVATPETAAITWTPADPSATLSTDAAAITEQAVIAWAPLDPAAVVDATGVTETAALTWTPYEPTASENTVTAIPETAMLSWTPYEPLGHTETGIRFIKAFEVQLQRRIDSLDPLWRSPIWSKVVAPPPLRVVTEYGTESEAVLPADASLSVTVPLQISQIWTRREVIPGTDNPKGSDDCAPACVLAAIHLTAQGTIWNGAPPDGSYFHPDHDTAKRRKRRVNLIETIRREGGSGDTGGCTAVEMARGYRALGTMFRRHDRTKPECTVLNGSVGTWQRAVRAMRAGDPVMVNIDYRPLDWYPKTRSGDEPYPQRHLVSGQWGATIQHSVLVYDIYRQGGEDWVRYMDPLADGRDSSTAPRPVAKGPQTIPLSVLHHAVRLRQSRDQSEDAPGAPNEVDGLIFRITRSTKVYQPPVQPIASGTFEFLYDGPRLPDGEYTVRYRCKSVPGDWSEWEYDNTLVIVGEEPQIRIPEMDYSARMAAPEMKARVILRDIKDPYHDDPEGDESPDEGSDPPTDKPGWFVPPLQQGLRYRTTTYATDETDNSHYWYAVDFNRGSGDDDEGDWVRAAAAGTVTAAVFDPPNQSDIVIEHSQRYQTAYSHMKSQTVSVGDEVVMGQRIGRIGDVGEATDPHLHHQHRRRPKGTAFGTTAKSYGIKMRFRRKEMKASLFHPTRSVTGQTVTGPTIRDTDTTPPKVDYSRAPGRVRAVIEDPQNLGVSGYASSRGELYFTLPLGHRQIGEIVPYQRWYEVQQYRHDRWERVSEGLIRDTSLTEDDMVIYGIDMLGVLSMSVESAQPGADDDDEPIWEHGSKYIKRPIATLKLEEDDERPEEERGIINDQIQRAFRSPDSLLGWVRAGHIDAISDPTTIHAAFVQRLAFIRGLLDSARGGTGRMSVVEMARDPAESDGMRINVWRDYGEERPELRLEYGSLVQGFEVIPFGDFAVRVHGVGHKPLEAKPLYRVHTADGVDIQTWGDISKVRLWNEVEHGDDLSKRVLEEAANAARIGKRVAVGIRVRGLDPLDRWRVGDQIPLAIKRGPIDTRYWTPDERDDDVALSWWRIWGWEWRVATGGNDELSLVLLPRVDSAKPLDDTDDHPFLAHVARYQDDPDWETPLVIDPDPDPDPDPPTMTYLRGIDTDMLNHPDLPLNAARSEGVSFSIVKLTQGVYWGPSRGQYVGAVERGERANRIGMVGGFYHFLTRVEDNSADGEVGWNTGRAQCDFFISNLPKDSEGDPSPDGFLIAVDVENISGGGDPVTWNGRTFRQDPNGPEWEHVRTFVRRWFERFPLHPLFIYSSPHQWFSGHPDVKALNANVFCWNAHWADGWPKLGRNWNDAVIHEQEPKVDDPWTPGWGGFSNAIIWQGGWMGLRDYQNGKKVDGDLTKKTLTQLRTYAHDRPVSDPGEIPVEQRPSYRAGYNALLAAARAAMPPMDAGAGDAYFEKGEDDAIVDILGRIPKDLTDPDA